MRVMLDTSIFTVIYLQDAEEADKCEELLEEVKRRKVGVVCELALGEALRRLIVELNGTPASLGTILMSRAGMRSRVKLPIPRSLEKERAESLTLRLLKDTSEFDVTKIDAEDYSLSIALPKMYGADFADRLLLANAIRTDCVRFATTDGVIYASRDKISKFSRERNGSRLQIVYPKASIEL